MQAKIAVHSLRHEYVDSYTGEYVRAFDNLSLEVAPGEFLTVALSDQRGSQGQEICVFTNLFRRAPEVPRSEPATLASGKSATDS